MIWVKSRRAITWLRKSTFIRHFLIVMTGTALAQVIGFASTPIISRLYLPDDFGVFGSYLAISGIITAAANLGYNSTILLPKGKLDALHLFIISCSATASISLLCALACAVQPYYIFAALQSNNMLLLVMLVFTVFISGINISLQAWCIRAKAFKNTSASQIVRSFSSNGMQVGLGLLKAGPTGLILSNTMADFFASLNLIGILWTDLKTALHKISWHRMKCLAGEYKDFLIYNTTGNIIDSLSAGLPVLLLTKYYGVAVAGAYAFGLRLLGAPMGLILRALQQVLLQKACETDHRGDSLLALYIKITAGLFALSLLPTLILLIWSPEIFSFFFGQQWRTAGEFARSLVLWQAFMFCNLPSVLFARILRLQRRLFLFDIILLTARILVLVIGGVNLPADTTILLFSAVGAIMNIIFILIIGFVLIKKEGANSWKEITSQIKEF